MRAKETPEDHLLYVEMIPWALKMFKSASQVGGFSVRQIYFQAFIVGYQARTAGSNRMFAFTAKIRHRICHAKLRALTTLLQCQHLI